MRLWRIRHKPTGLHFKPTKRPYGKGRKDITNLHQVGNIYTTRPSLSWVSEAYDGRRKIPKKEWEIEEIQIVTLHG